MSPVPTPQARGLLLELSRLASGLCQDTGVRLELGDRWAWSPEERLLLVNHQDLLSRSLEVCAGIVAHEAGHHLISRYHLFLQAHPGDELTRMTLNAVEDARVEAFLPLRYPGVAPWLRQARETVEFRADLPWVAQFLLAIASSSTLSLETLALAPEVREALAATETARALAVRGFLPDPWSEASLVVEPEARWLKHLAPRDRVPRHPREFSLLHLACGSFEACTPILEAARQLHARDQEAGHPTDWAQLQRLERVARRGPGWPPSLSGGAEVSYERALAEVKPQIERMRQELERSLPARRRLGWRAGFASGQRVDLRLAMQAEASPKQGLRLWSRKNIPARRRAAFGLLVDLSGSMAREGRIEAAMAAVVLFCETLASLEIPFRIDGFQDELIPMLDFDEPLDPTRRKRLGSMALETRGLRPGGHNQPAYNDDGPCLQEAAVHLLARPEEDRVLVVLCDGFPDGRRSNVNDLSQTIGQLSSQITLVGLGIGPATPHVANLYPIARSCLPVPELASELGKLLQELLLASGPPGRR